MKITALLHDYQPLRDLFTATWVPLEVKLHSNGEKKILIPHPDGKPADNWNKRILEESYRARAESKVYSRLPFNFGPTLLQWVKDNSPETADIILKSDKESQERYSGHGNAVAQAWTHAILPLANKEDRETHLRWGIKDFETHYERSPEGMWFPEAAVDIETLHEASRQGIKFVILSPYSASRIKLVGGDENSWIDVGGGKIDPSRAYKFNFSDGSDIAVFFYDKNIAFDVAFQKENSWLYQSSENFLRRLLLAGEGLHRFHGNGHEPLVHFASDGETFGHHIKGKAKLLEGTINLLDWHGKNSKDKKFDAELTNYGLYLEENPPTWEVDLFKETPTAWSCEHGVKRWGGAGGGCCECGGPTNQNWRQQLRVAINDLGDDIDGIYYRFASKSLKEPKEALDDYIHVILEPKSIYDFFEKHARRNLSINDFENTYKLLEMEKFKLLMSTSCGWFHESVNRIEPFTNLICANSAIKLAKEFRPHSRIEERFFEKLPLEAHSVYRSAVEVNNKFFGQIA